METKKEDRMWNRWPEHSRKVHRRVYTQHAIISVLIASFMYERWSFHFAIYINKANFLLFFNATC